MPVTRKIDKTFVGRKRPTSHIAVEATQLRMFLKSIGETADIFDEREVAIANGFRDIPIPATYLFCLHMMSGKNAYKFYHDAGVDLGRLLHGEQSFSYHAQVCVGDDLYFDHVVADVIDKNNGSMTVIEQHVRVTNQKREHVADMILNTIVMNPVPNRPS